MKRVLSSVNKYVIENGIVCDDKCFRWFHPDCVNLNKTEYDKFANDVNKADRDSTALGQATLNFLRSCRLSLRKTI